MFMVVIKNPATQFFVDDFDTTSLENEVKAVRMFTQERLLLFITKSVDANIAYVKEMSKKEIQNLELERERIAKEYREKYGKILTPDLKIPKGKPN